MKQANSFFGPCCLGSGGGGAVYTGCFQVCLIHKAGWKQGEQGLCIVQALWCRAITFLLAENIEIKNFVAETCINKCLSKPSKLMTE